MPLNAEHALQTLSGFCILYGAAAICFSFRIGDLSPRPICINVRASSLLFDFLASCTHCVSESAHACTEEEQAFAARVAEKETAADVPPNDHVERAHISFDLFARILEEPVFHPHRIKVPLSDSAPPPFYRAAEVRGGKVADGITCEERRKEKKLIGGNRCVLLGV